jgi:hypothetical protein
MGIQQIQETEGDMATATETRENKPQIREGTSIYIDGELLVTIDKDTERPFRARHAMVLAQDLGLDWKKWLPAGTEIRTKESKYGLGIGGKRTLKPRRLFMVLETAARIQKEESDDLDIWRKGAIKEYEEHAQMMDASDEE